MTYYRLVMAHVMSIAGKQTEPPSAPHCPNPIYANVTQMLISQ